MGQTLSRQLDVFSRSLGRLFPEAMEDVDAFRSSCKIDRPVRTGQITHTNLAYTCSDRRHRFPVVRIEPALDPEQLMAHVIHGGRRERLEVCLGVPEPYDRLHVPRLRAYLEICNILHIRVSAGAGNRFSAFRPQRAFTPQPHAAVASLASARGLRVTLTVKVAFAGFREG